MIKKNKSKYINRQLKNLNIFEYNADTDKPIPQMKRSVYFKFETKQKDHHWFRSFVGNYAPDLVGLFKWMACFKRCKKKRSVPKVKKVEPADAEVVEEKP